MEKDKSRGIKHVKDKKKYKGNSVKNIKYVPSKSKTNLGSNWDRYESAEEDEHQNKLSTSTDFSLLSNAPISFGSHFQFKNEKIEENEIEKVDLFCLDLDLLHASVLTVPFYERLGIEKEYFKNSDIKKMDQDAQKYLAAYNESVQTKNSGDILASESLGTNEIQEQNSDTTIQSDDTDILELIDNCKIDDNIENIETLWPKTSLRLDLWVRLLRE